jgi:probable F420-dependent oxidoreductase
MSERPTLSLSLTNFSAEDPGSWDHLLDFADHADAAGVDRLVAFDHVVFGHELDDYGRPELGGAAGGKQPTGPDGHWLEPLTLLSVIAGRTSRIRLATGILIAALRRPVVLAKAAATLDVLSKGRFEMGVGIGWQRKEYEAAGLDFAQRGRLLDQTLETCHRLWCDGGATINVGTALVEHVHQMPKPHQPGGIPIWVGGTLNPSVLRRIVTFGSGWIPWGTDAADPAPGIEKLRRAMLEAGRGDNELQVNHLLPMVREAGSPPDLKRTMEPVHRLSRVGVTDFQLILPISRDEEEIGRSVTDVVDAFREAVGRA